MNKKKIVSLVLALALLLSCMSITALADGETTTWNDGDTPNSKQIFYSATAKVEPASGTMSSYNSDASLFEGGKGVMVFNSEITSIPNNAFKSNTDLTQIILPSSVTSIGNNAFFECKALTSVSLPAATSIGDSAFYGCTNLASVSLPAATSIGDSAFYGCTNLASVSLPAATSIKSNAFYGCILLGSVSLPAATSFGNGAFANCTSLTSVYMPKADTATSIFTGCTSLKYVYALSSSSSSWPSYLQYCSLYPVNFSVSEGKGTMSIKDVDFAAVDGCVTYIKKETSVTIIVTPADGYKLDSLTYAVGSNEATTITSPYTIESMPESAVTVTATVTYSTIWNDGDTPNSKQIFYSATAKVEPDSSKMTGYNSDASLFDTETKKGVMVFNSEITSIPNSTFYLDGTLTQIILPSSVTSIGQYAFYRCSLLKSVSLPAATSIGNSAFYECKALTSVSLPAVTTLGNNAFYGCSELSSVSMPAVISIGEQAFYQCKTLLSVSLPAATSIGGYAFYECSLLESVSLPAATSIGNGAFNACSNLTSVSLPAATSIGNGAFDNCTSLTTVYMPKADTATSIFTGCTSLKYVYALSSSSSSWPSYLQYCSLYPVNFSVSEGKGTMSIKDVDFAAVDGCVTYIKKETSVTIIVTPADGYKLDSLTYADGDTEATTITSPYTIDSMPTSAVTVTATFDELTLDLEDSTTDIPESTTIDQYYIKTEGSEVREYNRIQITYPKTLVVEVAVSKAQKWDVTSLSWVDDTDGTTTVTMTEDSNVHTFTLTNYSPNAFTCTMSFTPVDNSEYYDSATFEGNGETLAAIENSQENKTTGSQYFNADGSVKTSALPTLTIKCTLNLNTDAFKSATATDEAQLLGKYTIVCTKVSN